MGEIHPLHGKYVTKIRVLETPDEVANENIVFRTYDVYAYVHNTAEPSKSYYVVMERLASLEVSIDGCVPIQWETVGSLRSAVEIQMEIDRYQGILMDRRRVYEKAAKNPRVRAALATEIRDIKNRIDTLMWVLHQGG